ncbi:MAG: hypothetical protein ACI32N_06665 [Bulleidia sp.]
MSETLSMLSLVCFGIAVVLFILSIFFWFSFKIPEVYGDLSGKTARKSIEKMRAANEKTGRKSYRESKVNLERGKLTATMPDMGVTEKMPETTLLEENRATSVLTPETGLLDETEAEFTQETALLTDSEETGLLDDGATGSLEATGKLPVQNGQRRKVTLRMIDEAMFVHTKEVIE